MKKKYMKPTLVVIKVKKSKIICSSSQIPNRTTPLPEDVIDNAILG